MALCKFTSADMSILESSKLLSSRHFGLTRSRTVEMEVDRSHFKNSDNSFEGYAILLSYNSGQVSHPRKT